MKYAIWAVKDETGAQLELMETEPFLDIIDVMKRASNRGGVGESVQYLGDLEIKGLEDGN